MSSEKLAVSQRRVRDIDIPHEQERVTLALRVAAPACVVVRAR
ncbi:MAG TPA: hypothetical protein VNT54_16230 [Solirubrobacteraceae bacterium]|nr:hypothetical protein [Solirubrobacteraceae bacterium]